MTSLTHFQILIDLTEVDPDLEPEDLEELTRSVVEEIGELVEDARLVRETELPEGGKPALGGFVPGMFKAAASLTGIKTMLDVLGDRFDGKNLPIKVEVNGNKYEFEYRTQEQLENAIAAIEKLKKISKID